MLKWFTRIGIALSGVLLLLFFSIYFGGERLVQKYLGREIILGAGRLHLVKPTFQWSLNLTADSVHYQSPNLQVAAGTTRVSIQLFQSFIHFSPTVSLHLDTVQIWMTATPDSAQTKRDSVPFPVFKLPAEIKLTAGRIAILDSLGMLATIDGIQFQSQGPQAVNLSIQAAGGRALGALKTSVQATVDWRDSAMLLGRLTLHANDDSVSAGIRLAKSNLMRGSYDLRARVASTDPYRTYLNFPTNLPKLEDFSGDILVETGSSWQVALAVQTSVSHFSKTGPIRLTNQQTVIKVDFSASSGHWSLSSLGKGGEEVGLEGNLFVTASDSLQSPDYLFRHLGMTGTGHVHGVAVTTGGKELSADLEIIEARVTRESIQAEVASGEGSRIKADMRHSAAGSNSPSLSSVSNSWNSSKVQGRFSVDLAPGERWLTALTDTHLVFRKFRLVGTAANGSITAKAQADGLKAYGALADSLRLQFRFSPKGLTLEPSHWYQNQRDWSVSGKVNPTKSGKALSLSLENPEGGSAELNMPKASFLQVHLKNLVIGTLPYRGLDSLPIKDSKVSGFFAWDQKADTGHSEVSFSGKFKQEELSAKVQAAWTRDLLEVREMQAAFAASKVEAGASLRLQGRPFYALGQTKVTDIVSIHVKSDRFDMAKVLSLSLPNPPLRSGSIMGDFSYQDSSGFDGTCTFQNMQFQGDAAPVTLKELAVHGNGDALVIKAVTVSEKLPIGNDTLSLAVYGVLKKDQVVSLNVKSSSGLMAGFQGNIHGYQNLEGRLAIDGDLMLPDKQGELRGLALRSQLSLSFKNVLQGLRLDADTLRGTYAVPGMDTQNFSATVKTRDGLITIPHLIVKGQGGDVEGHAEYAVQSRRWSGALTGQSLAAQISSENKVQIRDFRIDVQGDSAMLNVQAAIGGGSFEQIKSPLRALGDFSRIAVLYRKPLGNSKASQSGSARLPFLRLSAVLDSSTVRYRLRSLESLQKVFKKSPARQTTAHRTKPMDVQISVETAGTGNTIETDVFRSSYVGNISMIGTYPYALMRGRISSREGSLGTKKQAYRISRFDVKWPNVPLEEGEIDLNSEKKLARSCEANVADSCSVIMRLGGTLNDMQFSYDSDCQGSYGDGVQVSALVFSVRRGCYSPGLSGDGSGLSYEEKALTLLETPLSGYLSEAAEKISGKWIASANVTGLGALAQDKNRKLDGGTANSVGNSSTSNSNSPSTTTSSNSQDAIALEVLSKEFWRIRLRAKSAYKPELAEDVSPWAYLLGLEWRPPLYQFIDNPVWKQRVKNRINMDVSVFTDPNRTQVGKDKVLQRVGFNYNYDFWGYWWSKPVSEDSLRGQPRRSVKEVEDQAQ